MNLLCTSICRVFFVRDVYSEVEMFDKFKYFHFVSVVHITVYEGSMAACVDEKCKSDREVALLHFELQDCFFS